jgi:hypothetical protein
MKERIIDSQQREQRKELYAVLTLFIEFVQFCALR